MNYRFISITKPTLFFIISLFLFSCSRETISESVSASSRIVTTAPANVTVNSFAEDLFGYMWMGTKRGVIRYDGDKYLRYLHNVNVENSIPSNIITTLFCDSRGTMWVGTVGGVARQNNMDEFCPVEFEYPEGRSESVFEFFESPDGKVYMSTADLLQVYDPQQNKFVSCMLFDHGKALTSFKIDSKGRLWYLSEGIVRSKPSPESDSKGTVLDIAGTNVSQMILLENNVLCTMNNKGFLIWSTELNIIVHDGLLKGYPNLRPENIQSIYPGASTTFYMITTKNEVWMYDYSTGVAVMIDAPASTSTLYLDRHEKLWLGTTDNGFETVNASDIGDGSPTRLANLYRGVAIQSMYAVPDGRIIINSADYGLYFFTPELGHLAAIEFQKYSTQKPLAVYMDSEDRLWVGTSDKCHVFRLNGYSEKDAYSGTFFLKELGVFNIDTPTMFQEDADGNVWLATSSHSLYVCRRGTSKLEKLTLDVVSGYMYFPQLVKARDSEFFKLLY